MNRLFGSKSSAPKPSLNTAIGNLDSRIESLDIKLSKLNGELTLYQQKLSKMNNGPGKQAIKQKAMKVLKQRKMIEQQKEQLEIQSWNMEQAISTTENLKNAAITVEAMKVANKELKKQYGKINIDKVENLQDEMADLIDISEELQNTMTRNYAIPDDVSESELDAELEALGDDLQYDLSLNEGEQVPSYLQSEPLPTFVDEPVEKEKVPV